MIYLLFFAALIVFNFWRLLWVFFTQDDFVLINEYANGKISQELARVFSYPSVSHFRPLHDLYFFVNGNLFGLNYFFYHLVSFSFLILLTLFVFLSFKHLLKNSRAAFLAAVIFAVSPIHFTALGWISGGALLISFFVYMLGFLMITKNNSGVGLLLCLVSLLASEAMIVGILILIIYYALFKKNSLKKISLLTLFGTLFVAFRFLLFTPSATYDSYKIQFGQGNLYAGFYYLTKLLGFSGTGNDLFSSAIIATVSIYLVIKLVTYIYQSFTYKNIWLFFKKSENKILLFSFFIVVFGLLPFIVLPTHLSPHYSLIALYGTCLLWGFVFKHEAKLGLSYLVVILILFASYMNTSLLYRNSWVIDRSIVSQKYIDYLRDANIPDGSTLIFGDGSISSSREAYISLGTGKAIDLFFKGKGYSYCFDGLQTCTGTWQHVFYIQ
ncbi:hypothetical protein HY024_02245 [Candidatus Curtissbacteria bacterium]|nr:hypothetical protein [Candidatus Curtissbacteria bacterium]